MRGSDSERMMAEIEAFLRTGEGPPAAPEPRPVTSIPEDQPAPPDPFAKPDRTARPPGRFSRFNPLRRGLPLGRPLAGVNRWRPGGRPARKPVTPPGLPPEPPRWTVVRALLVAAVLVGLLLIPEIFKSHSNSTSSDGPDQASPAPAGPGYAFASRNPSGTPVRWNPCEPVYYVTNLASGPSYAGTDLELAVAQISRATGILFVNRGTTTTFPSGPVTNSEGTAGPVIIAWADPNQSGQIPDTAGAAGVDALAATDPVASEDQSTGHSVYVSGTVLVNSAANRLPEGFGPGGLGILYLHELGHLVGLDSIHYPGQVMDSEVLTSKTTTLGSGDLAGLKRLGTESGCLKVPANGTLVPNP